MRSRFSAFALGDVDHLWRTLHPDHPDRSAGREAFIASVRRTRATLRYVRLRVLDHDRSGDARGRVLFHAEIYERGKDRSFLELSLFDRTEEGWRYLSGEGRALASTTPGLESLKIATCGV